MSSGVSVDDVIKTTYNKEMKLDKKFSYLIMGFPDKKFETITILKRGMKGATYDEFVEDLTRGGLEGEEATEVAKKPKGVESRYAVFDYQLTDSNQQTTGKIVYFLWVPEHTPIRQKMVYAASNSYIKSALVGGIVASIEAFDESDLCYKEVEKLLRKSSN